jgi:hypothetical protein
MADKRSGFPEACNRRLQMRDLNMSELTFVSGGHSGCHTPCPPDPCPPTTPTRSKNNNGYGNGAESGPAPGNSGANNPQLLVGPDAPNKNSGPRGVR